jgi:hypothetical protein
MQALGVRFWERPTGEDKTAILFSTAHKAGALAEDDGL